MSDEPFRNRSLLWFGLAVGYAVLLVLGFAVIARSGAVGANTQIAAEEISKQEKDIAALESSVTEMKRSQTAAVMTVPDRVALRDAHALIDRKALSWTQLLSDLERYVPANARLSEVAIASVEGTGAARFANVKITALGRDAAQASIMLSNFDHSGGRFGAEPVQISPPEGDSTEYKFELDVVYRPGAGSAVPEGVPASAPSKPRAADSGDEDNG